jgi:hypothetical protein
MFKSNTSDSHLFDTPVNKSRAPSHAYTGASLTLIALSSGAAWTALAWLAYTLISH